MPTTRQHVIAAAVVVLGSTTWTSAAVGPGIGTINASFNTPVFTDSLDTGANWTTIQSAANGAAAIDATATFGFDYKAGGTVGPFAGANAVPANRIPQAPNGSNSLGLVLTAQDVDDAGTDAAQAIAARLSNAVTLPGGQTSFAVRFDLWTNYTGGTGTSEFAYYGLNGGSQASIGSISTGTTGTTPANATAGVGPITSGLTLTNTGDGGFARDLRAFNGTAEDLDAGAARFHAKPILTNGVFGTPSQEAGHPHNAQAFTNGTAPAVNGLPGNQWLDVVIYYDGTDVTWYLNGVPIYTAAVAGLTPSNAFLGYMDMNASVSPPANQTFAVFDNFRVVVPEPTSLTLLAGTSLLIRRNRRR